MRWPLVVLSALAVLWPLVATAQTLPDRVFESFTAMPRDAQAVVAAVVDRVQGGTKPVAAVRFAPALGPVPPADTYTGFTWRGASLFRYDIGDTDATRSISGLLEFDDPLGRKAAVLFEGAYAVAGNTLEVNDLTVASHFLEMPRSAMFVLPADALTGATGPVPDGHAALFAFAQQRAISWERPDEVVAGERDYAIVVFLLDRVSPSAKFEVKLSDKRTSPDGFAGASRYLNDGDWRMGVVAGKFALDTVKLFVKAVVTPGTEQGVLSRQPEVTGLYALDSFAADGAARGIAFRAAPAGQSLALERFDGEYKFKLRMRGGNGQCAGVQWRNSEVKQGKITGELFHGLAGIIPISGTISPTGEIKVQGENAYVIGTGTGQVEGETASGKFEASVDIEFCRGTWTAKRLDK
jgi:hypothetical protein